MAEFLSDSTEMTNRLNATINNAIKTIF